MLPIMGWTCPDEVPMRGVCLWRAVLIVLAAAGGLAGCYYDPYTGGYYPYPPYPAPYRYPYPPPYPGAYPAPAPYPAPPAGENAPVQQAPLPPPPPQ